MPQEVKLVVIGNSGVGKTSLIQRFVTENFRAETDSTVGASYMTKIVGVGDSYMKFNIWDTAGQERFRSIVHMYYKEVGVAILVYDLSDADSFHRLSWWHGELRQHIANDIILAVVANKEDLVMQEKVPLEEAKDFAASIGALYFRTSAKSNHGIAELFINLASLVIQQQKNCPVSNESVSLSREFKGVGKKKSCCA